MRQVQWGKEVRETEHSNATHAQIQTKVTTLEQKINDAVNQILKVEDKAANLMPLYLLVTSQVLPLANFVVSSPISNNVIITHSIGNSPFVHLIICLYAVHQLRCHIQG